MLRHVAVQAASRLGVVVVGVCSGRNAEWVKICGATTVIDYSEGDIIQKLQKEAENDGKFDMVLDCVNSADGRDKAAAYYSRIVENGQIVKPPGVKGTDNHNYVVLGGTSGVSG